MYNDLLIVFSNYNGMRTKNDLTSPRIEVTVNSFKEKVPYYKNLNVLLLDNNSNDGSDKLMESLVEEAGSKWKFVRKDKEDYYLGTLYYLLHDYKDKFKYLMIVDNDQYFTRPDFIPTIIDLLNDDDNVAVQLSETTEGDSFDSHKNTNGVGGFFDKVFVRNNEVCLRAYDFKEDVKGLKRLPKTKGVGQMCVGSKNAKRVCWQWYGYSNICMNINKIINVFGDERLALPYKKNPDRLALFSSSVRDVGRTIFLARGVSINFGFRKYIKPDFKIKSLIEQYEEGCKGWHADDKYSFFVKNGKLTSIEKEIDSVKEKNNL
jgi:hypothetical protein